MSSNFKKSYIAGGTISSYAFVSRDAAGKVIMTTASNDDAVVGVAQTSAVAGDSVEVVFAGLTRVVAGETLTIVNDPMVTSGLAGRAYSANAAGEYPLGNAQTDTKQLSVVAGDEFLINFTAPNSVLA
jgi:hypothetical protein